MDLALYANGNYLQLFQHSTDQATHPHTTNDSYTYWFEAFFIKGVEATRSLSFYTSWVLYVEQLHILGKLEKPLP